MFQVMVAFKCLCETVWEIATTIGNLDRFRSQLVAESVLAHFNAGPCNSLALQLGSML